MTAFARAEHGAAIWEIRSVNHRYLDVNFRLQDNMKHLEGEFRNISKGEVHRGKLECTLKIKSEEVATALTLNTALIEELKEAMGKVQELTGLEDKGDALSLLRWPDVMTAKDDTDGLAEDVCTAYQLAIEQLVEMRKREGQELADVIESKLKEVEITVNEVRKSAPDILASLQTRLKAKLDDLGVEVDPGRLEQEFVIQAQKLDVMEELDRLDTHIAEVRRSLASSEPVGRRLDFLMQELNREANTLSSKAQSSDTTLSAVDLKVLIEQMREQVQNIE